MDAVQKIKYITSWIKKYADENKIKTLVVGISGGIDSAVVSALCAKTKINTVAVSMPILQNKHTHSLSLIQGEWLCKNFPNIVKHVTINLTPIFQSFQKTMEEYQNTLSFANSRSRLRMVTLYHIAQSNNGIVVGTGNKVEDFGVGFFTKYGDGGVDISPIGDCLKTEVWEMGKELGVISDIINAEPTDGLWDDNRTDKMQLGMSYTELEKLMQINAEAENTQLTVKEKKNLKKYKEIRNRNIHKMFPIPVCKIP